MANLTPQEKRQYLLAKYNKRDYNISDVELCKKYAVYLNRAIDKLKDWTLVCVCDNEEQAKKEILWRKKYHETNDGDLVLDNDKRFETFRDETKNVDQNGNTYEPGSELMKIDYNRGGNMLEVLANSANALPAANGFRGIAHYSGIELDYVGFYKIDVIYEVS